MADRVPRGDATRSAHPGFQDMAGRVCGTWTVLSRAPNAAGNAQWRCRHECGATSVLAGIQLRSKPPRRCANCRGHRAPSTEHRAQRRPFGVQDEGFLT